MISRKEKAVQRGKARRKRVAMISLIVGVIAALAVCAGFYFSAHRSVTSIEKVVSEGTDVLFVSEVQDGTWDYFMYLSGYDYQMMDGVETIGFANEETLSYVYLTGDTEKIKSTLDTQGIPYGERDDVVALGHEGWNFADDSLAENREYSELATKTGNKTTFAYVDFEALTATYPESYHYSVPRLGKWSGTYADNRWTGETTVDKSLMDETKKKDEISRNPEYRDFVSDVAYHEESWAISPVTLELLADMNYETNIDRVKFDLDGQALSLTLEQEN